MNWISIALTSYFLSALAIILDKFILGSKKISSPPVYAFYIGILGLGALIFLPFGLYFPSGIQIFVSIISGALFTFGILSIYYAIQKGEASRVAPLAGAVIPLGTYLISLIFFGEKLASLQFIGALLLISGGLLISFDLPLKVDPRTLKIIKKFNLFLFPLAFTSAKGVGAGKKNFSPGFRYAILSGLILAVAYSLFKVVYNEQSFFSGFIWTRFGSALAILIFFIVPSWRKSILRSLKAFKKPTHSHLHTGLLVILNKITGGIASVLFNYAIALGSVTLVNALVSSQYVFILILAAAFSVWHPKVFEEKLYFWDWAQKVAAIIIIGIGVYLIAKPASIALF